MVKSISNHDLFSVAIQFKACSNPSWTAELRLNELDQLIVAKVTTMHLSRHGIIWDEITKLFGEVKWRLAKNPLLGFSMLGC